MTFSEILGSRLLIACLPKYFELVHLQVWWEIYILFINKFTLKLSQPNVLVLIGNLLCAYLKYSIASSK